MGREVAWCGVAINLLQPLFISHWGSGGRHTVSGVDGDSTHDGHLNVVVYVER